MGRKSRYLGWVGSCPGRWANVRVKERYPGGRRCVQVGGQVFQRVGQVSKRGRTTFQGG